MHAKGSLLKTAPQDAPGWAKEGGPPFPHGADYVRPGPRRAARGRALEPIPLWCGPRPLAGCPPPAVCARRLFFFWLMSRFRPPFLPSLFPYAPIFARTDWLVCDTAGPQGRECKALLSNNLLSIELSWKYQHVIQCGGIMPSHGAFTTAGSNGRPPCPR